MGAGKKVRIIFLTILVSVSAMGQDIEPPDPSPLELPTKYIDTQAYELKLNSQNCEKDNCRLWSDYVLANCSLLLDLAEKKDFPLRPFALMKAASICKLDKKKSQEIFNKIDNFISTRKPSRWLTVSLMEAQLELPNLDNEIFVTKSLETAKLERTKKAKVDILTQALSKGKKISHKRFLEVQSELFKVSAKLRPVNSNSDWLLIANDAFSNHDYELAAKAYQKVSSLPHYPPLVKRQALDQLRQSYKILQKKKEALHIAVKLWNWDKSSLKKSNDLENAKRYLASGLALARLHWTEHRNHDAQKILKELFKLKNGPPLSDVFFISARMSEEEGDNLKALDQLNQAIKISTDTAQKASYQWTYAWLSYKLKKYPQALEALQNLKQIETDPGKKFQQLFWLAQTYQALGKPEEAKPVYEQLIGDDPLGFYSLLAYRELKIDIPKPKLREQAPRSLKAMTKNLSRIINVDWNLFNWLLSVGEYGFAKRFLAEEVPLPDLTLAKEWKDLVEQYSRAHYYSPIFGRLVKLSPDEKVQLLSSHSEFLFPMPYKDLVDEAGQRTGLWPEFIFSIMRQESSFDAGSISPANAYGLLQLLPNVARQVAKREKIHYGTNDDLLEPSINIPIGAYHLRSYWDEFDGQFILATAAYNASPETVKQWVNHRYHGNILEFIEDIPYEETRTYVKLVLRNFINYLRLNTSSKSFPFPEWCLEGVHTFNN